MKPEILWILYEWDKWSDHRNKFHCNSFVFQMSNEMYILVEFCFWVWRTDFQSWILRAFGSKKSNKSKLSKHLVPVNTVNTKIISTFVASVPIFASIQHISPHLGTTLIQIINGHSIYWKNVINSPALYHCRWNSAYWCLESIIWVWHCSGST